MEITDLTLQVNCEVKITFGIIVLNGEPFTRFTLRALYPHAHQIIIVEGANYNSINQATDSGHSIDSTLDVIREFIQKEDIHKKVNLVTAEDEGYKNGFWPGEKDEQSQSFAKRATGNWLWQVDIDEFYRDEDIQSIIQIIESNPEIATVTFPEKSFWGSFDYCCDGPHLRSSYGKFHRLFKWNQGYKYLTHRPPTVIDENGLDLRLKKWITSDEMKLRNIYLYHYCQIFPGQVQRKMKYYAKRLEGAKTPSITDTDEWCTDVFIKLEDRYHVHTVNTVESWLVQFKDFHPAQIENLRGYIDSEMCPYKSRNMLDVEKYINTKQYWCSILFKQEYYNFTYTILKIRICLKQFFKKQMSSSDFCKSMIKTIIGEYRLFRFGINSRSK